MIAPNSKPVTQNRPFSSAIGQFLREYDEAWEKTAFGMIYGKRKADPDPDRLCDRLKAFMEPNRVPPELKTLIHEGCV